LKHPQGLEPARLEGVSLMISPRQETMRESEIRQILSASSAHADSMIVLSGNDSSIMRIVEEEIHFPTIESQFGSGRLIKFNSNARNKGEFK
jgi:hypothetical protein